MENIEKIFHSKSQHLQVEPATESWSKLNKKLRQTQPAKIKKLTVWSIAASFVLLVATGFLFQLSKTAPAGTGNTHYSIKTIDPSYYTDVDNVQKIYVLNEAYKKLRILSSVPTTN